MAKINYRALLTIPTSKNFSEFFFSIKTDSSDPDEDMTKENMLGDNSRAAENMVSVIEADILLINLLIRFTDRQKIILMYLILRESGYNLTHADCARTLSITREHYMFLLKGIKKKASKIIQQGTL